MSLSISNAIQLLVCQNCGADNNVGASESEFTCNKCAAQNVVPGGALQNQNRKIEYSVAGQVVGTYDLTPGVTLTAARGVDSNDSQDKDRTPPSIDQGGDKTVSSANKEFTVDSTGAFVFTAPSNMVEPLFIMIAVRSGQTVTVQPSQEASEISASVQEGEHVFNIS